MSGFNYLIYFVLKTQFKIEVIALRNLLSVKNLLSGGICFDKRCQITCGKIDWMLIRKSPNYTKIALFRYFW